MLELGFVYKVTNSINGKVYVGETKNTNARFCNHAFQRQKPKRTRLESDIDLLGVDNFIFEILEICLTKQERRDKEDEYIRLFDSTNPECGYNTFFGIKFKRIVHRPKRVPKVKSTLNTKLSEKAKQQWQDPVLREKMKQAAIEGWKSRKRKPKKQTR